ncbi:MAG: carboxylating nicotinate-nucleotide diphosphorylase [Helicobacteraceae bacterium]|jgi:nicotinate-nucleotide pyrophosphorylase (carboxylating)|nr:carboxylating nicotinate-nucleotide diphosphorylase [Helicobacteraceae bacterium]
METCEFAKRVIAEDLGRGDLFEKCAFENCAALSSADRRAIVKTKSEGIFAGLPYAEAIAKELGVRLAAKVADGEAIKKGDVLLELTGNAARLLQIERALLNTLQHASGIATNARAYAKELAGGKTAVLDTRKTRPLLREFEKYAARIGGAKNHRLGLDDCLMIKDTHWAAIGAENLAAFVRTARRAIPWTSQIEVECETIAQVREAFAAGAEIVMCDNMSADQVREVVALRNEIAPSAKIEASGNITLENIAKYAAAGVDAISAGAIIHHAVFLDFSMKMI